MNIAGRITGYDSYSISLEFSPMSNRESLCFALNMLLEAEDITWRLGHKDVSDEIGNVAESLKEKIRMISTL